MLGGKPRALNSYITKEKRSQINYLSWKPKKLETLVNRKLSKRKEVNDKNKSRNKIESRQQKKRN